MLGRDVLTGGETLRRKMLPALGLTLAAVALALVGASGASAQTPSPVLSTGASEFQPSASPGYLAWAEAPKTHPDRVNAYARPNGQPRIRMNAPGTYGFTTGGAIDGTTAVYGERLDAMQPGDLKFFDLVTGRRTDPPPGVNTTRYHEWGGSLAGDWLLFDRETISTSTERIVLFNLRTRQAKQLDIARGRAYAQAGSVRGNYAVWIKCSRSTRCNTYVHDISAGTTQAVPNPAHKAQYAASVTSGGVVYFAESSSVACGSGLALWRYPLGGVRTKVLSLGKGRDVSETSPLVNPDGSTTLFYDRYACRTGRADIFKVDLRP
jgi:hypothetical protein